MPLTLKSRTYPLIGGPAPKRVATRGGSMEASYDRVWGVGLSEDDNNILNPGNWQGSNWLGQVLTVLKDDLLASRCSMERLSWDPVEEASKPEFSPRP